MEWSDIMSNATLRISLITFSIIQNVYTSDVLRDVIPVTFRIFLHSLKSAHFNNVTITFITHH